MTLPPRSVVFSDLDGTLVSLDDYDWTPARPALEGLARRGIPLVLASSKTRAEIEIWRERLGLDGPFISENGGALWVPRGATPGRPAGATEHEGYLRVEFGAPYGALRRALAMIAAATGLGLRGFGDLGAAEVERLTGLPPADLAAAMRREHDEPFLADPPLGAKELRRLEQEAAARGLRVTRGGRFHHLTGPSDKGRAARALRDAYAPGPGATVTLALGDGANDLELLAAADRAVVVARPDGSHAPELRAALPEARFTRAIGPAGFAEAVLAWLERPW